MFHRTFLVLHSLGMQSNTVMKPFLSGHCDSFYSVSFSIQPWGTSLPGFVKFEFCPGSTLHWKSIQIVSGHNAKQYGTQISLLIFKFCLVQMFHGQIIKSILKSRQIQTISRPFPIQSSLDNGYSNCIYEPFYKIQPQRN